MRYAIRNGQIVESLSIDAPYDTRSDAEEALQEGVVQHDEKTVDEPVYKQVELSLTLPELVKILSGESKAAPEIRSALLVLSKNNIIKL